MHGILPLNFNWEFFNSLTGEALIKGKNAEEIILKNISGNIDCSKERLNSLPEDGI